MTIAWFASPRRRPVFLMLVAIFALAGPVVSAQTTTAPGTDDRVPERGGREWQFWTGGGEDPIGTPNVTLGNGIWNAGARYGWVLTDAHGPGILRGRFEYAVEAMPILYVYQPGGRAYGIGFSPWIMKWNLEPHRRISPYIELGGGGVVTTRQIPNGASYFNFTPSGAIGINLLRGKYHWSIDFRYFHISDAQLTEFNPGTDTFGVRIGFGGFIPAK